jgi:hypothetical protein
VTVGAVVAAPNRADRMLIRTETVIKARGG